MTLECAMERAFRTLLRIVGVSMGLVIAGWLAMSLSRMLVFGSSDPDAVRQDMVSYHRWGAPAKEMGFEADKQCGDTLFGETCYYYNTDLPASALATVLTSDGLCVSDRLRAMVNEGTVISIAEVQDARQACSEEEAQKVLAERKQKSLAAQRNAIEQISPAGL